MSEKARLEADLRPEGMQCTVKISGFLRSQKVWEQIENLSSDTPETQERHLATSLKRAGKHAGRSDATKI